MQMSHSLFFFYFLFFQSNEYESPTGDLRYGHAFDSRCAKHSPAVSPNASSPVLSELDRTPDCGCQVRILSWYSYIISYNHACFLFSFFFCMTCLQSPYPGSRKHIQCQELYKNGLQIEQIT